MLKQRIFTAAVGVPLIILAVWFGDPWFSVLISAVALVGTFEFYHMSTDLTKRYPLTCFGLSWSLALALSPHYANILPVVMTAAVVISLVWLLCLSPKKRAFDNWPWLVAGVLYVGWMLSYWINLRGLEDGRGWVYLAILTTFANDTGAFFVGRAWGKHQLAPALSPGKTWEGALGGLLSAVACAIIVFLVVNLLAPLPLGYWQAILLGCVISVFAQVGDLVESLLKRSMGVKQSGKLLPGHGGMLDRFDSLIFVGAMVYYYVIWTV